MYIYVVEVILYNKVLNVIAPQPAEAYWLLPAGC